MGHLVFHEEDLVARDVAPILPVTLATYPAWPADLIGEVEVTVGEQKDDAQRT